MPSSRKIKTPRFRVSYAHVFQPKQDNQNRDVYSVTMIFEPDADLDELRGLIQEAKVEKFGKAKTVLFPTIRKGIQKSESYMAGYDLEKNPEYDGKLISSARSYNTPVGISKLNPQFPKGDKRRIEPITDPKEFYSGCYAIATVTAYGYVSDGSKGVALSLQNIIKVGNGEPLVAQRDAAEDFKDLDDSHFDMDDFDEDGIDDDEEFDLD